jgi:hypothetical protein
MHFSFVAGGIDRASSRRNYRQHRRYAARRRWHHQRTSGDLHVERWEEDSESDRCGDRNGVTDAGGEFPA